jgi:release factor glutamine methyltransferase
MASETWTVRRLLEWTEEFLRRKAVESPRLEAQILLAHVLGCKKIDLYVCHDEEPSEDRRTAFREMIKKRAEGMPVAYLVGHREFYSLEFAVSPAVLIPRPETETLVMEALRRLKPMPAPRVLDLGTGSGAIAVAIAKQHRSAVLTAVDVIAAALDVASGNARRHGVSDRIAFIEGDLFAPIAGQLFDMIVSNPPYVADREFPSLDAGVRNFEPQTALAGGVDGLDFYRRIADHASTHLVPGASLLVEIGATQESAVRELFAKHLEPGPSFKDAAGRPRVVSATRRPGS